jgi:hypothetical protein
MAITAVGSLDSATGTALTTLALAVGSACAVGDVRVFYAKVNSNTITVSSLSGGDVTTWHKGPSYNDNAGTVGHHEMWWGIATAAGHTTITVTWSSTPTGLGTDLDCRTFSNGNTSTTWTLDSSNTRDNAASTTITYASITAAGTGELACYHARCPSGGSYGTPSGGGTWVTATDANGNPYIYSLSVGSGAIAPTQTTTSTDSHTIGLLLIASVGGASLPLAADGLASSSGTASITLTEPLVAAGLASSSGTATLPVLRALSAAGLASSSGSIQFTVLLAADGLAASSGTATLLIKRVLAAAGLASSSGTAVLGAIHLPDPFTVVVGAYKPAILGCGTWRVFLASRGGMQLLTELDYETLTVQRTLDSASQTSVILLADRNPSCAPLLAQVEPFQHEIVAFRDYQAGDPQTWAGPVMVPTWDPISLHIDARDLFSWFDVRNLPTDRVNFSSDLADIFSVYVQDALSLDPSPGITVSFMGEIGTTGIRSVTAQSATIAGDALRELSRSGVDFTTVGRSIRIGGMPPTAATTILYDSAVIQDASGATPKFVKQGLNLATSVTLKGGQDVLGNTLSSTVGDSDGIHGLVSRTSSEPLILDLLSLTKAAAGRLAFLNPAPLYLTLTLSPQAPIRFDQLIPGIRIDTAFTLGLIQVVGKFRLNQVDVTVDQNGEAVALTLTPMVV